MKPTLNSAVDTMTAPPIPEAQGWAQQYDESCGPLIDLSQAVPGYPAPDELLDLLSQEAGSPNLTGYGPIQGENILRSAYADHVGEISETTVKPEQTLITSGCNQAFIASAMAVAQANDTILMTNPRYFNHETTLAMLGVRCVYVDCDAENGFLPNISSIRAALKDVKAFALVSPNNPTGTIYPPHLLSEIFEACRESGTWLILDETYRDFMEPHQRHGLFLQSDWSDVLIQLYSFSKSFCIPGHRLGAIIAGERVVDAITKVVDNIQICAPRAAQSAVAQTIKSLAPWREGNQIEIQNRARAMREAFHQLPEWQIISMGAYFAYVRHPFPNKTSAEVSKGLATEVGVSCLPGSFFGEHQDGYLRIAFANVDAETISTLPERLKQFRP